MALSQSVLADLLDAFRAGERVELIRDSVPDACLVVIEQAAHLANVEQPEELTQALLEHLEPAAKGRVSQ